MNIQTLTDDCGFSEGPVWHPEGFYLFSDIPRNGVYRALPEGGKELFIPQSGFAGGDEDVLEEMQGSNGLGWHPDGSLVLCQHGNHGIARWKDGWREPLVTEYKGRPLNSPNDLVVRSDGSVFFSDPPYGLKGQQLRPERFQPVAGVYRWQAGDVQLVTDAFQYPNGVCLSPDEKVLYVCSNKPFERRVLSFDAGTLQPLGVVAEENGDGIECDPQGNLYLCSKEGIVVVRPQGRRLRVIPLPAVPSNLCWGGASGKELCVTARQYVLRITGLPEE